MTAARPFTLAAGALLGALLAGPALAHNEPYSFVDLDLGQSIEGRVVAHIEDLAHEAGLSSRDSLFVPAFVASHLGALHRVLEDRLRLKADGDTLEPRWGGFEIVPERKSVAFAFRAALRHPLGRLEVPGPLFLYDPLHETYLNLYEHGGLRHQDLLDRSHRLASYYSGGRQGVLAVVRTFVIQGVHHIFIGPDHILFVVGLLLLGGSIGRLLEIVTAFTVAHTVTLVLATLRIVNPPSRVIEPAIALSIVYVGVESLLALRRARDWRVPIAFSFGFVHGFGFASVLREFGLPGGALGASLASFNVGVEVGQACIVLTVAPLLAWLRAQRPEAARGVVVWASVAIIAAGAFWLVQRILAA